MRSTAYYVECSRAPQGVAATLTTEHPDIPAELALGEALRAICAAAREHHGEDMLPSQDPADYSTHRREADALDRVDVHVYLRPDHPWWDGPIAGRVARRNGVDADTWRRMNEYAAARGLMSTAVRVPAAADLEPALWTL